MTVFLCYIIGHLNLENQTIMLNPFFSSVMKEPVKEMH